MTMPNRNEIIERAFGKYHKENIHTKGINPTISELKENGDFEEARRELMRGDTECLRYLEKEAASLGYVLERQRATDLERQVVPDPFTIDLNEILDTGLFISGTSNSGKSNLAFVIADMLMMKGVIVYAIDPSQAWKRSSVPNRKAVHYPKKGKIDIKIPFNTVFDISRLTVLQQKEFVEKFCKAIFESRVDSSYRPQTFIFFEEAHFSFLKARCGQRSIRKRYG